MKKTLTVAQWNVEADGGEQPGEEWETAHEILAALKPDVLFRNELKYSRARGHQRLHAAQTRLGGMHAVISARNPLAPEAADVATGVFVLPELFDVVEDRPVTQPWWLHPAHVTVRLRGCPALLHLVSFHHCFYSPQIRQAEAQWLTTLASPGQAVLAAGDTNSYARTAVDFKRLPDWTSVTDLKHREHRTRFVDGAWISDTEPDRILHAVGYHDPAVYAAEHLGQDDALKPTAGYRRPDQGGPQRIDRHYNFGIGPEALARFTVLDTPETRRASDHAITLAVYDYPKFVHSLDGPTPAEQGAAA